MTEVLVVLSRPESAVACLNAAAQAASALPLPHLTALHVTVDPAATILASEEVMTGAHRKSLEQQGAAERAALQATFQAWRPPTPQADWVEAAGTPAEQVLQRAVAADLVAMALPGPHPRHVERAAFDAVLFESGHPLLAVPPSSSAGLGMHVAVGWRDGPHTRRAIAAAQPWLARAGQITAIEVTDGPAVAAPLPPAGWQGVFTQTRVAPAGRSDGEALLAAATACGADLLVLGAYRRSRLLEWVLGGVTDHVLRHATLPVLLIH